MTDDLISRAALLAAYDKAHVGPPGGARKLIEEAPATSSAEIIRDFLATLRNTAKAWHGRNEVVTSSFCANCPLCGEGWDTCVFFRGLKDSDIENLIKIYTKEKEVSNAVDE